MTDFPLGVYGLQVHGEDVEASLGSFVPVPPDAPELDVEVFRATSVVDEEHVDDEHMVLSYRGGMRYEIDRSPARWRLHVPSELNAHALVHPMLTIVGSVQNRWRGRLALHGGAFVHCGKAWGVLAEKTGGKSSILAGLSARDVPVLTDDLVVVAAGRVLPGPRSVDLRPEAAAVLQMGEDIGWVGNRVRQRVALPVPPLEAPLAGFVVLRWSQDGSTTVRRLSQADKLSVLANHDALPMMGPTPAPALFDAMASPMLALSRARSWDRFEESLDRLLSITAS